MDENCRGCLYFHIDGAVAACNLGFPPSPEGRPGQCDHKVRGGLDMFDLREEQVQVVVRADRKVLWVNLPDRCVLRIQGIMELQVEYLGEKS